MAIFRWLLLGVIAAALVVGYTYLREASYEKFYLRGLSFYTSQKYQRASTEFQKAISEAQESDRTEAQDVLIDSYFLNGEILDLRLHRYRQALTNYKELADLLPNHPASIKATLRMAQIYKDRLDEPREAIRLYKNLLEQWPDASEVQPIYRTVIESFITLNEFEQAVVEGRNLIAQQPEKSWVPEIAFLVADALAFQEKWTDAISEYQLISQKYPKSYESRLVAFEIGNCKFKQQKYTEALGFYEKALATYPNAEVVRLRMKEARVRKDDESDQESLPFWARSNRRGNAATPPVIEPFPEDRSRFRPLPKEETADDPTLDNKADPESPPVPKPKVKPAPKRKIKMKKEPANEAPAPVEPENEPPLAPIPDAPVAP